MTFSIIRSTIASSKRASSSACTDSVGEQDESKRMEKCARRAGARCDAFAGVGSLFPGEDHQARRSGADHAVGFVHSPPARLLGIRLGQLPADVGEAENLAARVRRSD